MFDMRLVGHGPASSLSPLLPSGPEDWDRVKRPHVAPRARKKR